MEERSLIEKLRELSLRDELSKFDIKFALVYGSVALKKETSISDIDIAVYCEDEDFLELAGSLTGGLSGRKVDLVNLKSLSAFDCYEILSRGKVIFVSPGEGEDLYQRTRLRAMKDYLDFEGVRRRILHDMRNRIENGRYGRPAAEIERA